MERTIFQVFCVRVLLLEHFYFQSQQINEVKKLLWKNFFSCMTPAAQI